MVTYNKTAVHDCCIYTCDERLNIEYRLSPIFLTVAITIVHYKLSNFTHEIQFLK